MRDAFDDTPTVVQVERLIAQRDAALADLAASQALAESRGLVIAQMREACIEEVGPDHDEVQCSICLACWPVPGPPQHEEDCFLAQPADAAAALAGAVLAAADLMADRLEHVLNRLDDRRMSASNADITLDAYRRARAALRGDGEAEG